MPLGLLGGMLLAGAGQYGFDQYYSGQQEQKQNLLSGQLEQARQGLLAAPSDPSAQANAMAAGMKPEEVRLIQQSALRAGLYKDQAGQNAALTTLSQEYRKDISAPRQALTGYQTVMNKYARVGGDLRQFNGADDMTLSRTFVKMQNMDKPEAFMSDDAIATQTAAVGGVGSFQQIMNVLSGKGTLDDKGRAILIDAIGNLAGTAYQRYGDIRSMYERRASGQGLSDMTNQFMLPQMGEPPIYQYKINGNEILRKNLETGKWQRAMR